MKRFVLLLVFFVFLVYGQELLVRVPYAPDVNTSALIKKGIAVIGELDDAALIKIASANLSLLAGINYQILDEITDNKNYYLVTPFNKEIANQIRTSYEVLTSDRQCLLVVTAIGKEVDLIKLPVMLTKLDFTQLQLSEHALSYPKISFNPLVQQMVDNVSADTVLSFVRRLQNYRSRYATSESCRAAGNWLRSKFLNYNCDSVYLHNFSSTYAPNVVAIKRGYAYPDNIYYVIGGHYDAVNNCPGADDNGSGTSAVLEAARVMKDYNFAYSIRYICFCAEEQGLIGSAAYAQQARANGDSILGMINFDMISYTDVAPENLEVFGKVSNPNCSTFVNYFINTASLYVPQLTTNRRMVTSLSGSDHHSFWQQGYVALCGIEDYPLNNPYYHTSGDSIGAGFNDLNFCTNTVKAGVACLASLANPIYPNQPLVIYRRYRVDDAIGNNNNRWDIGETTHLYITLRNIGQTTAHNVSATIACTSAFVAVLQNQAGYGNISSLDTAVNQLPFIIASSPNTQIGYNANFALTVSSSESTWNYNFTIPIGAFVSTDPIPDGPRTPARYWAYDNTDTLYYYHPTYNWVEIKNIGNRITYNHNDQVRKIALPAGFGGFRFYGQRYDTISVSVDGFIRIGADTTPDYTNSPLPNPDGPAPMIAVNWDDLYHANTGNYGGIWWYYDQPNHRFIVEWDSVYYYNATSVRDKFQVIIYDSTYSTPTQDNIIIAQYQTANRYSSSTIGIEDPTETIGIQYLLDGTYHAGAAPIVPGRAIKYTTQSPTGIAENIANSLQPITNFVNVYPNPFKDKTVIQLNPRIVKTKSVQIYNSSGRLVKTLLINPTHSKVQYLIWDGNDEQNKPVSAGIYFVVASDFRNVVKVIRLK
ncbi:MAG: M28 family peptidase [candidate division WOR-3 bacterium]